MCVSKKRQAEAPVQSKSVGEAPIAPISEAPAEAKDESNEFISVRQLYGKAFMMSVKEAKELGIIPSATAVSVATDEDAILDEIVGEMEALNAEASQAMLERPMIATAERPESPTEFAQALNSAYSTEIRRLTDGKRTTRSATKMKKSGI